MNLIEYAEQVGLPGHRLRYRLQDGVLIATLERQDGTTLEEVYDLSGLQPGDEVVGVESEPSHSVPPPATPRRWPGPYPVPPRTKGGA